MFASCRCEDAARVVGPSPHGLTRGEELVACALGKGIGSDADEHLVRAAELFARVDAPVLSPKPLAVSEPGASEVDDGTAACEPLDCLAVQGLRVLFLAQERT